jgi:transcriptional regulator with XRE-family HTH domain
MECRSAERWSIMHNLPKILKALRKQNKLRQQDVADYLNISRNAYTHYELGISEPDINNLIRLAKLFKVSVDYLIGNYVDVQIVENNPVCG